MKIVFNDTAIIEDCLKGKRHAQEALYKNFSKKMFATAFRYAGNMEIAQDILQDGFVKVFNNLKNYNGSGSLEGWIRRIVVNTSLDYLRKKTMLFSLNEFDMDVETTEDVSAKLNAADLMQMVSALPDGYRTIFNLYAIEGFSHREISEMLQVSEGTSKSQLARARNILKNKVLALENPRKNEKSI
jgi:RNA polymerase sigma-70 factor (ECF subfamily)